MSNKKANKKLWQLLVAAGILLELLMIYFVMKGFHEAQYNIPDWQILLLVGIAVWIYIAFLKQRSFDISHSLVEEKIRTHTLAEHLSDGILLLDPENHVLLANPRACAILRTEETQLLGSGMAEKTDAPIQAFLNQDLSGEVNGTFTPSNAAVRLNIRLLPAGPDGSNKLVYVHASAAAAAPLPAAGSAASACPAAQVAERSTRQAGADLATLLKTGLKPEAAAPAAMAALRCLNTSAVLALSRAGLGKPDFNATFTRTPWQAAAVLAEVTDGLKSLAGTLNVRFDLATKEPQITLQGRADLLKEALFLAMSNAMLDVQPQGAEIKVRTTAMGTHVGIAIIDTGPTPPPEAINHCFDWPYLGVVSADGKVLRGQGAGYHLLRQLVEAHGGTVTVESLKEGGLRMTMMIPGMMD